MGSATGISLFGTILVLFVFGSSAQGGLGTSGAFLSWFSAPQTLLQDCASLKLVFLLWMWLEGGFEASLESSSAVATGMRLQ